MTQKVMAYQASPQLPAMNDPLLHLLNRISYGPRPEEVSRLKKIGVEAYLNEQLNPEKIADADMDKLLKTLPILFMNRHEVHQVDYRQGEALIKGMIAHCMPLRNNSFIHIRLFHYIFTQAKESGFCIKLF